MYDYAYAVRMDSLALNRVSVANQILGCAYDFARDNPLVVDTRGSRRAVTVCGDVLAVWSVNRLGEVRTAYERLDSVSGALWSLRRSGCVSCGDLVRTND